MEKTVKVEVQPFILISCVVTTNLVGYDDSLRSRPMTSTTPEPLSSRLFYADPPSITYLTLGMVYYSLYKHNHNHNHESSRSPPSHK